MNKDKAARRIWVKDDIKVVLTQWESKTREELAEVLGASASQITYIATQARKLGYNLPRKHKNGVLQNLLKEAIADLKNKKKT